MMRSLVDFVEKVMAKTRRGEARFCIKIISVSVDSRSVLDWIGGGSVTYKFEECRIIERIYEYIRQLGIWDITVILSWVRAHNDMQHNKLADDRAKTRHDESTYLSALVSTIRDAVWARRMGVYFNKVRAATMYEGSNEAYDCCMDNGDGCKEAPDCHWQAASQKRVLQIPARLEHLAALRV